MLRCVNGSISDRKPEEDIRGWVNGENVFCSALVDRIVPGWTHDPEEVRSPAELNGYEDSLMDVGEVIGIRVIEGPDGLEG